MRFIQGFIGLALVFYPVTGCEGDDGEGLDGTGTQLEICDQAAIDEFTLAELVVGGDALDATVRYGGGCKEHDFRLCWDGSFMESNPVQARLTLIHDGHGDGCEALITETLTFELTPMKTAYSAGYQTDHGQIIVHLEDKSATFEF